MDCHPSPGRGTNASTFERHGLSQGEDNDDYNYNRDCPNHSSRDDLNLDFADAIASIEEILPICGAPGLSLGVIRNGQILTKSFGLRDVEKNLPVDRDSKFLIGSVPKTFLSAAVAIAVAEGCMRFDDPMLNFLPDFNPTGDPSIRTGATLRHMLSHTSGLGNPQIILCGPKGLPLQSEKEFINFVNAFPTRTTDGQQRFGVAFNYTNAGYALPALALQKHFNCRYSDFLQNRILTPLGMTRTAVTKSAAVNDENIAFPHARLSDSRWVKLNATSITNEACTPILASMGIRSSVGDLLKWCQHFLSARLPGHSSASKIQTTATSESDIVGLDSSTVDSPDFLAGPSTKPSYRTIPTVNNPSTSSIDLPGLTKPSSKTPTPVQPHTSPGKTPVIPSSQMSNIFSQQWIWHPNSPDFSSYCLGWMATSIPSSKLGKHSFSNKTLLPPTIGESSPSQTVFQSSGSAIVACANGNTNGDAADWATKVLLQSLFNLEPTLDFVKLAAKEAVSRQEQYVRILEDWETNRGSPNADTENTRHRPEDYVGRYFALNTTITILRSSDLSSKSPLHVTFNELADSQQQLTWYKPDCWSWFPTTRDEWLQRMMIDWDYWGTGIFHFVREEERTCYRKEEGEKGGENGNGNVCALMWQWDEWEPATRFVKIA